MLKVAIEPNYAESKAYKCPIEIEFDGAEVRMLRVQMFDTKTAKAIK